MTEERTSCTGICMYIHPLATLASSSVLTLDTLIMGEKPVVNILVRTSHAGSIKDVDEKLTMPDDSGSR